MISVTIPVPMALIYPAIAVLLFLLMRGILDLIGL